MKILYQATYNEFFIKLYRYYIDIIILNYFRKRIKTINLFFFLFFQEPSPLYDNNHYHEECLKCNSCGLNLTGPNQKRARR